MKKLVHGPQAAAAGAVVAGQAQEWTDGVVARLPGVKDVKHSGRAKSHEACDCIDSPCGKSVPSNRLYKVLGLCAQCQASFIDQLGRRVSQESCQQCYADYYHPHYDGNYHQGSRGTG